MIPPPPLWKFSENSSVFVALPVLYHYQNQPTKKILPLQDICSGKPYWFHPTTNGNFLRSYSYLKIVTSFTAVCHMRESMIFESFEIFLSEPRASDLPPNKPVPIILTFCFFLFGLRVNFLRVSILILVNITSRVHLFKFSFLKPLPLFMC